MRRSVWEVAGETLREIGILWAVFFMLDDLMDGGTDFSSRTKLIVLAVCMVVVAFGIYLECRVAATSNRSQGS
jgi:hypothetical protein